MPTNTTARFTVLVLAAVMAIAAVTSAGDPPAQATITIDHSDGKITRDGTEVKEGQPIRLKPKQEFVVQITNTNTALYDYKVVAEKIDVEEIKALQGFFGKLGPYLLDLPTVMFSVEDTPPQPSPEEQMILDNSAPALEALAKKYAADLALAERFPRDLDLRPVMGSCREIETNLHGENGVRGTYLETTQALGRMNDSGGIKDRADELARNLCSTGRLDCCSGNECPSPSQGDARKCVSLKAVRKLHDALATLNAEYARLGPSLPSGFDPQQDQKTFATIKREYDAFKSLRRSDAKRYEAVCAVLTAATVLEQAEAILGDAEKIMASAYTAEALALRAMDARSTWQSKPFTISLQKGKKLTVRAAPRKEPELARLATPKPLETELTVLPKLGFKPAFGLALVASPDSTFPKYTKDDESDEFNETGTQDGRFTYGLTLGLTYGRLDWRKENGLALWVPEVIINPSDDLKAVGCGVAFSWKSLKIGTGYLWTKHTVLEEASTRTRETYGSGEWYISFSVIGWPPFVAGD